jgi:hypothetical protein
MKAVSIATRVFKVKGIGGREVAIPFAEGAKVEEKLDPVLH